MRKIIRNLLIGVLLVLTVIGIAACVPSESGEVEYTVTVTTVTGDPQPGVSVQFSDEESVLASKFTNSEGSVTVSLPAGEYKVELVNLPEGYMMDNVYTTDKEGTPIEIMMVTGVISGEAPEGHIYSLGSVMYDFTYTEVETGETKSLTELLETKRAVLLNFWYSGCSPCRMEFPLMQEAYLEYQDNLAIVALNPEIDTADACAVFKQNMGLTFDVAVDTGRVMNTHFNVAGYPTSVMIDRYGVVCEIEAGGITDVNIFRQLFDQYTDEDYEQDVGGAGELEVPDVEAPGLGEFAGALNDPETASDFEYYFDENEYNWPWLISGDGYVYNSNSSEDGSPKNSSFAIFYLDATLEEDEVLAFEYMTDTEADGDIFYFFVDGEIVGEFSGSNDWTKYYAYLGDGEEHEFAFAYVKDATLAVGEDTVGLKNMRITDVGEIESEGGYLEILRQAATGLNTDDPDNPYYEKYVDIYLADDGYYHVGTKADGSAANGDPYLLAEMNEDTQWGPALYSTALAVYNQVVDEDGNIVESAYNALSEADKFWVDKYDAITDYAWLGRFSDIQLTPVTQELKDLLVEIVAAQGNSNPNDNETEWLEICRYLQQYGDYEPMTDPIIGLRNWNAIPMKVSTDGVNNANHLVLNKILVPRGIRYKITVEETASYIFYSVGDHTQGNETMAWLFSESTGDRILAEGIGGEGKPAIAKDGNFEIVYTLEAGETYYLACCFYNPGLFGEEYDFYCMKYDGDYIISPISEPMFTTEGDDMGGDIILPQYVDVAYFEADDTWFVVDDNGEIVSPVLVDIANWTPFSDDPLTQWISSGRFNFSANGYYGDGEQAGEGFEGSYKTLPEDDRVDYTAAMQAAAANVNKDGYITATGDVVHILKLLMQLEGQFVDNAWTRVCYYMRSTV